MSSKADAAFLRRLVTGLRDRARVAHVIPDASTTRRASVAIILRWRAPRGEWRPHRDVGAAASASASAAAADVTAEGGPKKRVGRRSSGSGVVLDTAGSAAAAAAAGAGAGASVDASSAGAQTTAEWHRPGLMQHVDDLLAFADVSASADDTASDSVAAYLRPRLQVLFIKRAVQERDAWSGQVAFPGGTREPDETDFLAAVRETQEEVGLDLTDSATFACVGRLDDRAVRKRGKSLGGFSLSSFVFLQLQPATGDADADAGASASSSAAAGAAGGGEGGPARRADSSTSGRHAYTLSEDEVAAVLWADTCRLHPDHVDDTVIERDLAFVPGVSLLPLGLRRATGIAAVNFPSVDLGGELAVVASKVTDADPNAVHRLTWHLWGLSLGVTSDLLAAAHSPSLVWPPIRFQNRVANFTMWAVCGAWELLSAVRRPAGMAAPSAGLRERHFTPRHLLAGATVAGAAAVLVPLAVRALM